MANEICTLKEKKPTPHSLIDAFLQGRNANTRDAYSADLADFATYLQAENTQAAISHLLNSSQGNANFLILEYRNSLKERGLQSATINRRLSSIRAVVRLGRMLGLVPWTIEIPNEKSQPYRDVSGVGINGIEKILTQLQKRSRPQDIRNAAIIRLFYDLGLRRNEVVQLDITDLDLEKAELWILGKGRTQKEKLTLPDPTIVALKSWLAVRTGEAPALFTSFDRAKKGDGRISGSGVYKVIRWLGNKVNLKIRPHGIRHDAVGSAVRVAKENDIILTDVLKYSRHKNLSTLQIYVDAIENRQGEIASLVAEKVGWNR